MDKKLFVATPMYGGQCTGYYTTSLLNLSRSLDREVIYSFMFNESLITRARNGLTHGFLKSEAQHLMFIDADIHFNPQDIQPMIDADKDVICGIYPKKEINWHSIKSAFDRGVSEEDVKKFSGSFVVNLVDNANEVTVPINQPVEIWNGGTGFMLIKREVFEKLSEHVPSYVNDVHDLAGNLKQDRIKEFFATSIEPETDRLLSEDYHFCKIWRGYCGGKVWAAPWVKLGHIGTYAFEGQLLQS